MDKIVAFIISLFVAFLSMYLWQVWRVPGADEIILDGENAPDIIAEGGAEFEEPEIIRVTQGVWVAVGYALSNSILIEGPLGLIVVDTTESEEAASEIASLFRNISSKPIHAIVYTHNHADHCRGTMAFIDGQVETPAIITHNLLPAQLQRQFLMGRRIYHGAIQQFGLGLDKKSLLHCGIGPRLRFTPGHSGTVIQPTKLIENEEERFTVAGLDLVFMHVPGETQDQMAVWIPEKKVLLPADNIYKSFPNLYAIRGTPPRDVQVWAESLRKMAALKAHFLVPSHTRPIFGVDVILSTLTVYADAIQFVHDQSLKHINNNLHPDEAAQLVKLPSHLASHRYLWELYGTVEWSVKAVYDQYLGWFSGNVVDLHPLSPRDKASRMIDLMGVDALLAKAKEALDQGDLQWALELSSYVHLIHPSDHKALSLRVDTLQRLASRETSLNGRHYYLTSALDDYKGINWNIDISDVVGKTPVSQLLHALKSKVIAEAVDGVHFVLGINEPLLAGSRTAPSTR